MDLKNDEIEPKLVDSPPGANNIDWKMFVKRRNF